MQAKYTINNVYNENGNYPTATTSTTGARK